jgi:hypothetical protein
MAVKYITGGTADIDWANQNRQLLAQNLGTNDFQIVPYTGQNLDNSYLVLGGTAAEGGVGADINLNGASRVAGANRDETAAALGKYKDYNTLATNQINPQLNNQIALLNSALSNKNAALSGQKSGINQNYDIQAEDSRINTEKNRNNYNSNTLSRGLGRSTIATTGLAGITNQGNRILNNIETYRNNALSDIDSQIALNKANTQDQILSLQNSAQQQIQSLAAQLAQQDYEKAWNEDERTYQRQQDALDNTYRDKQYQLQLLNAQSSGSGGGGSGSSSSASFPSANNEYNPYGMTTEEGLNLAKSVDNIVNDPTKTYQDRLNMLIAMYQSANVQAGNTADKKKLRQLIQAAYNKVGEDYTTSKYDQYGENRATGYKPAY